MINKAKELNNALKELPLSKEYLYLKEKIKEDTHVNELLIVINNTQKDMKNHLKNNDIKSYNASKQTLELLKEEFFNNPIISNYIYIKEEMYDMLYQIANILSE